MATLYNYFRIMYYLRSLLRHAYWSRDRLEGYQNRKVREIVTYAYDHVPFYNQKFKQLGLKPDDIRRVEDLNKFPVVGREELQKNADKTISDEFDAGDLTVDSTSGSTGQPLCTYLTGKEDEFRKAKLLRANIGCGQKPRDRWAVIAPPRHQSKMGRIQRLLGIYVPITVSVFDDADMQVSAIEKIKPDVLEGYSSSLLLMAKEKEKRGVEIGPRIIIGGAELIDDHDQLFIEKAFDAPFYDQYSSVEFDALAWQCQEKNGYHIEADTIVMQFVDEDGEEVVPGEEGQIVCTSLFNYAMPLIRYAVGDIGILSGETKCPCGRTLPLMKVMTGRKDSIIVLRDGRFLSPLVIGDGMMFFKYFDYIDQYRVIQKKIGFFKILVKKKDSEVDDSVFEAEFAAHFRRLLKVDESEVAIELEFVDEIPVDRSGKIRKIISELKGHNQSI